MAFRGCEGGASSKRNIALSFLPFYRDNMCSILHRLLTEEAVDVRKEILANLEEA